MLCPICELSVSKRDWKKHAGEHQLEEQVASKALVQQQATQQRLVEAIEQYDQLKEEYRTVHRSAIAYQEMIPKLQQAKLEAELSTREMELKIRDELQQVSDDCRRQVDQLASTLAKKDFEIGRLVERTEELEDQLDAARTRSEQDQIRQTNLELENKKLDEQRLQLENNLGLVPDQIERFKEHGERLRLQNESLTNQIATVQKEFSNAQKEWNDRESWLIQQWERSDEQRLTLEHQLNGLTQVISESQEKLKLCQQEIGSKITELQENHNEQMQQHEQIWFDENTSLQTQNQELRDRCRTLEHAIRNHQEETERLVQQRNDAEGSSKVAYQRYHDIKTEHEMCSQTEGHYHQLQDKLLSEKRTLTSKLSKAEAEYEQTKKQLVREVSDRLRGQIENRELRQKSVEQELKLKHVQQQFDQLSQRYTLQQDGLFQLQETSSDRLDELVATNIYLKQEVERWKKQWDLEHDSFMKEHEDRLTERHKHEETNRQIEKLESELDQLHEKLLMFQETSRQLDVQQQTAMNLEGLVKQTTKKLQEVEIQSEEWERKCREQERLLQHGELIWEKTLAEMQDSHRRELNKQCEIQCRTEIETKQFERLEREKQQCTRQLEQLQEQILSDQSSAQEIIDQLKEQIVQHQQTIVTLEQQIQTQVDQLRQTKLEKDQLVVSIQQSEQTQEDIKRRLSQQIVDQQTRWTEQINEYQQQIENTIVHHQQQKEDRDQYYEQQIIELEQKCRKNQQQLEEQIEREAHWMLEKPRYQEHYENQLASTQRACVEAKTSLAQAEQQLTLTRNMEIEHRLRIEELESALETEQQELQSLRREHLSCQPTRTVLEERLTASQQESTLTIDHLHLEIDLLHQKEQEIRLEVQRQESLVEKGLNQLEQSKQLLEQERRHFEKEERRWSLEQEIKIRELITSKSHLQEMYEEQTQQLREQSSRQETDLLKKLTDQKMRGQEQIDALVRLVEDGKEQSKKDQRTIQQLRNQSLGFQNQLGKSLLDNKKRQESANKYKKALEEKTFEIDQLVAQHNRSIDQLKYEIHQETIKTLVEPLSTELYELQQHHLVVIEEEEQKHARQMEKLMFHHEHRIRVEQQLFEDFKEQSEKTLAKAQVDRQEVEQTLAKLNQDHQLECGIFKERLEKAANVQLEWEKLVQDTLRDVMILKTEKERWSSEKQSLDENLNRAIEQMGNRQQTIQQQQDEITSLQAERLKLLGERQEELKAFKDSLEKGWELKRRELLDHTKELRQTLTTENEKLLKELFDCQIKLEQEMTKRRELEKLNEQNYQAQEEIQRLTEALVASSQQETEIRTKYEQQLEQINLQTEQLTQAMDEFQEKEHRIEVLEHDLHDREKQMNEKTKIMKAWEDEMEKKMTHWQTQLTREAALRSKMFDDLQSERKSSAKVLEKVKNLENQMQQLERRNQALLEK